MNPNDPKKMLDDVKRGLGIDQPQATGIPPSTFHFPFNKAMGAKGPKGKSVVKTGAKRAAGRQRKSAFQKWAGF